MLFPANTVNDSLKLRIRDDRDAAGSVLLIHPRLHAFHQNGLFIDSPILRQTVVVIDPERDSRKSGRIGHGGNRRTVQEFPGIKNIVDFFVLQKAVGMDALVTLKFFPTNGVLSGM